MSAPVSFPAPIGGVPFDSDFAPSLFFTVLYGVVCLLGIWRMARKSSRSMLVGTTLIFIVERTVIWSLRTWQSKTPAEDTDRFLTSYWQMSFTAGYIAIYGKLLASLKGLMMGAFKPSRATSVPFVLGPKDFAPDPESSASLLHSTLQQDKYTEVPSDESKAELLEAPEDPAVARKRKIFKYIFLFFGLQSLTPLLLGIVMGQLYVSAETNAGNAAIVGPLRYVIASVCLALLLSLQGLLLWASRLRRTRKFPLILLFALALILTIIPIYHFIIMGNKTTSLISTAPGSDNTPAEKTAFYLFQVVPELITSATLLGINAKEVFSA
ncbi:uncharacterized protein PHACADRAFT_185257 [Phanerochaete carnosa HHB-10118-sp]|uniref:Uncharacterized protein n=2 Tax=Phanerochaete carnosa (strain HHB-10118-sp) TaxID=650164 RepID=K5W5U9_PHACS|nr:uncharacterized protein PHACADRAFT_185257 [Phanerochaete carnosa HHB-10118-sp]EKM54314.1 hypothetical protein PHACADRAFT_185257 [Phanerochaete carnosa HHB-10118-sp]